MESFCLRHGNMRFLTLPSQEDGIGDTLSRRSIKFLYRPTCRQALRGAVRRRGAGFAEFGYVAFESRLVSSTGRGGEVEGCDLGKRTAERSGRWGAGGVVDMIEEGRVGHVEDWGCGCEELFVGWGVHEVGMIVDRVPICEVVRQSQEKRC